jgi:hypothetical protein
MDKWLRNSSECNPEGLTVRRGSRRAFALLLIGETAAVLAIVFCLSGVIMAADFSGVPEDARYAYWQQVAVIYEALTTVCFVIAVGLAVLIYRNRKRVVSAVKQAV